MSPHRQLPDHRRGAGLPSRYVERPSPGAIEIGRIGYRPADPWTYGAILRRHAGFAFMVFVLIVTATLAGTLLRPKEHRAHGLVEIRREGSDVVPTEALFVEGSPSQDYLETQQGLLMSRSLALEVIRELRLHEIEEFRDDDAPLGASAEPAARDLQSVLERFQERLVVNPEAGGRLVRVSFEARDPDVAAEVVNTLLDEFVARRVEGGQQAENWLEDQVDTARARLEEAELALQEYARENGLPLARGDEDVAANVQERLDALERDVIAARADRLAAQARSTALVDGGRVGASDSEVLADLTLRIADLQREHARLASAFTEEYPEVRRVAREIEELEVRREEERRRAALGIAAEYEEASERERLLEQAVVAEAARSDSLMTRAAGYRILRREVDAGRERYGALREKLMEAEVSTALAGIDVGIVDHAVPPEEPYRPSWTLSIAFALFGGALLAIGAAFGREYMSPTVLSAGEVRASVAAPVLAVVPSSEPSGRGSAGGRLPRWSSRRDPSTSGPTAGGVAHHPAARSTSSAIADALGSLHAAVLFDQADYGVRSLLVTSAIPGEGKTTIAIAFAESLAGLGRDVLLVDADVRRSSANGAIDRYADRGLAEFLDGSEDEWPVLVTRNSVPGLDILSAGGRPPAPEKLLASPRFTRLLDEAQMLYDFVVVDGPALFVDAADAEIIADRVDGVIAVVRGGGTPRSVLGPVLSAVPNLFGVVLNDVDPAELPEGYQSWLRDRRADREASASA